MAEGDNENERKVNDDLDVIWWIPGVISGITLLAKYIHSTGIDRDERLTLPQGMLLMFLLFGPAILAAVIAAQFRKEVERGRMSWEMYWVILSGISASTLAFLGVTGIDDVIAAVEFVFSSAEAPR
ncbi:hypothetical protein [Streptomyces koyangensis]|uniref:Uncharacterized protein n=1 Tax=Streptomyces koyangensis TaxID=188770 RepID=A0A385DC15_9ACTN|nr:hypothetical protein [Streptomyces koyangensis]AXQ55454.1 hypothetical protein D0C37_13165 [Streptomyces koyangensis]MBZ2408241.1 hypothetical protein [Streptomyces sp. L06]